MTASGAVSRPSRPPCRLSRLARRRQQPELDNPRAHPSSRPSRIMRADSAICAELPEDIVTLRDGRPLVGGTPGGSRRPARAWPPGASTPLQPNRAVKMATSARAHSGTEATQPPISPAMRCRPGAITETALAAILPRGTRPPIRAGQPSPQTGSDLQPLGGRRRDPLPPQEFPQERSLVPRAKKPSDLRSPLTESNRRPSPYHGSLCSSAAPGRSYDLRKNAHTPALTSARRVHASTICHSICHSL